MRVCVTGGCGWTAEAIVQALSRAGHEVTVFDLPAVCSAANEPDVEIMRGDVGSFDDVNTAVRSAEAVVHLAVAVGKDDYRASEIPFAVNVRGTYNVFEAARRNSAGRIVLMSEAAVHLPVRGGEKLDARANWRSSSGEDHLYDLTKRLQEEIARDYSDTYGMSVITLRAGHIVDGREGVDPEGRSLETLRYCRGGWVCRYDLAEACVRALEIEAGGYHAYHVIGSQEAYDRFDVARTEDELGLEFESRFTAS